MNRTALMALLSHWRRQPVQALSLVLGLALATALWTGVQAINAEARQSYADAASALGGGEETRLVRPDGGPIPQESYVALRRAGWQVSPVLEGWVRTGDQRLRLVGFDPVTAPSGNRAAETVLNALTEPFFGAGAVILAAPQTAQRFETVDGLKVQAVDGLAPGIGFADISTAQRLLDRSGELSYLMILTDQPLARPSLSEIAPDLSTEAPGTQADLARLTDSFHLNLTAFGLLSFAVGLLIVHAAVGLAFEQRRPVFRTLRALGVPARRLVLLASAELAIIALFSGALGIALGYGVAAALLPDVAATLRGLYGASLEGTLSLSPVWWLGGLAVSLAGTAIAACGSLWKLSRLSPLAPAQPRAWARASAATRRLQLVLAGILAATAVIAGTLFSGLLSGFVLLGALLLAAALVLPTLLAACLALGERAVRGRVVAEWFMADTRQQLPGLSLALMALMLALAANIGVGTMVSSFRLTFTGWLDQRLASEVYVSAADDAQAAALLAWLEPRTDAILPIWHVDGRAEGQTAEIYGVADHATYRDNWPMLAALPDVWDRVAAGEAALINEQLARREGLSPGDALDLGTGFSPIVGGVYSDYGNTVAQVLISIPRLTDTYSDVDQLDFGLRLSPDRTEGLIAALTDEFGLTPDQIVDQRALKAISLEVFERTFAVTAALNVLTLSVAGFAILTSLLTLAAMRLAQMAPVWAMGMTRGQLARLDMLRAVILAVLTFMVALPVGLLLAWVLLAVINVDAFGWRLPMHLFPGQWVSLIVLAVVAAMAAALWPAIRMARIPPARLIGVLAHER